MMVELRRMRPITGVRLIHLFPSFVIGLYPKKGFKCRISIDFCWIIWRMSIYLVENNEHKGLD